MDKRKMKQKRKMVLNMENFAIQALRNSEVAIQFFSFLEVRKTRAIRFCVFFSVILYEELESSHLDCEERRSAQFIQKKHPWLYPKNMWKEDWITIKKCFKDTAFWRDDHCHRAFQARGFCLRSFPKSKSLVLKYVKSSNPQKSTRPALHFQSHSLRRLEVWWQTSQGHQVPLRCWQWKWSFI